MEVDGLAGEAEDDNFEERLETTWNNLDSNQSTSVLLDMLRSRGAI